MAKYTSPLHSSSAKYTSPPFLHLATINRPVGSKKSHYPDFTFFSYFFSPHFLSDQKQITSLVLSKEKRQKVGQQSKKVSEKVPHERLKYFGDQLVSVKVFCCNSKIRAKKLEKEREGRGREGINWMVGVEFQ